MLVLRLWLVLALFLTASHASIRDFSAQYHSCVVTHPGELWCWGKNERAQLGTGSKEGEAEPRLVLSHTPSDRVYSVNASWRRTCVTFESGKAKCWGNNSGGLLGLGSAKVAIGWEHYESAQNIMHLELGEDLAAKIAMGRAHSCLLTRKGRVKCWGINQYGVLGMGSPDDRLRIGDEPHEIISKLDYIKLGGKVVDLCSGIYTNCVLMESNEVKCWGKGRSLGNETLENIGTDALHMGVNLNPIDLGTDLKIEKLECGAIHSCVLFRGGRVKCWGGNGANGRLGLGLFETYIGDEPGEMGTVLPFVDLGMGLRAEDLQCGLDHCCAKFESGLLKCWGKNFNGNLAIGDNVARGSRPDQMGDALGYAQLGTFSRVKRYFVSGMETLAELEEGTYKRWGGHYGFESYTYYGDSLNEVGDSMPAVDWSFLLDRFLPRSSAIQQGDPK